MKKECFTCFLLCICLLLSACSTQQNSFDTKKLTSTKEAVPTLDNILTETPEFTPAATPHAIKPKVTESDRKVMLSNLESYFNSVKLKNDIFVITYIDDIALSSRYYAKFEINVKKKDLEYCNVIRDFYIDLLTKEIFVGSCLMPKNIYVELTEKFKNHFTENELKYRHIMLNDIIFEEKLNTYCYSVQLVSPGKDFLGTLGWYVFTEDATALYEMDIVTTTYTEIK